MSETLTELVERRDFQRTNYGLMLRDHRRVVIPNLVIEDDVPIKPYKIKPSDDVKGYDVWQLGNHLFILWDIMSQQNAAFFCALRPAPHLSSCTYLDSVVIGASQFAKRRQAVRGKVSGVERVEGPLLHVGLFITDGWKTTHKTSKADDIRYIFNLSTGKMHIVSREDASETTRNQREAVSSAGK